MEVNVERDLGFTSKRDIEAYGIAEFVTLCKTAGPDVCRAPDRAMDPPGDVERLERPGRASPVARPARHGSGRGRLDTGTRGTGRRTRSRCWSAGSGARHRRLLLHVQQREQRPDLGLPRRVPSARLAVQGRRHDALVYALRDGPVADQAGSRATRTRRIPARRFRLPLLDRAGEALLVWTTTPWTLTSNVAAAVGKDLRYVLVRQGDDPRVLARARHAEDGARRAVRDPRGTPRARPGRVALRGPVRRVAGRPIGVRRRDARRAGPPVPARRRRLG